MSETWRCAAGATDAAGHAAAMQQFTKALDERILERLLKLNWDRAAAEAKAVQPEKFRKEAQGRAVPSMFLAHARLAP